MAIRDIFALASFFSNKGCLLVSLVLWFINGFFFRHTELLFSVKMLLKPIVHYYPSTKVKRRKRRNVSNNGEFRWCIFLVARRLVLGPEGPLEAAK